MSGIPRPAAERVGEDTAPGLAGGATLTFARRGGQTVLADARVSAPLKVVRAFPLADGRLVVPLTTLGPGLCAGDRCWIDVHVEAGGRAVVIQTAATRVLGMAGGLSATQHVRLTADAGAHLEYYPGLTIPFPDSAFVQRIDASVAADARVGILETWALGRIARGEYLRFRAIDSRTTVTVGGALVYADATLLRPADADLAGAAVLDGRRYLASGFWYSGDLPARSGPPSADPNLLESGAGDERNGESVIAAFGQSAPRHVFLRALGSDGLSMDAAVGEAQARIAEAWEVPPLRLGRYRC